MAKRVTKYRYTLVRGATNIRASGNSNGVLVGRGGLEGVFLHKSRILITARI